jgi:hypothetical protein
VIRTAILALLATLALAVALAVHLPAEETLRAYVLVVGGVILAGLARAFRRSRVPASQFERALRRRERPPERPDQLARLERTVELAAASGFYVHSLLRPVVRRIVEARLVERQGAALPETLRDLVRPDRPPGERDDPGIPLAEQEALVDALEKI